MSLTSQYVDGLLSTYQERRVLPRTQIELSVQILVVCHEEALTDRVLLSGVLHDFAACGAMLSTSELVPGKRIWLHFDDFPGPTYLEADVVRHAVPHMTMAYSYGVEFARKMESHAVAHLIDHRRTIPCDRQKNRLDTLLKVGVGDVIDFS